MKLKITAIIAHMPITPGLVQMTRRCVGDFSPLVDKMIIVQSRKEAKHVTPHNSILLSETPLAVGVRQMQEWAGSATKYRVKRFESVEIATGLPSLWT